MGRESAKAFTYHATRSTTVALLSKGMMMSKSCIEPSFLASKGSYPLFQPKKTKSKELLCRLADVCFRGGKGGEQNEKYSLLSADLLLAPKV